MFDLLSNFSLPFVLNVETLVFIVGEIRFWLIGAGNQILCFAKKQMFSKVLDDLLPWVGNTDQFICLWPFLWRKLEIICYIFLFLPKLESQSYPIATLVLEPLETGDLIKIVLFPSPIHICDRFWNIPCLLKGNQKNIFKPVSKLFSCLSLCQVLLLKPLPRTFDIYPHRLTS